VTLAGFARLLVGGILTWFLLIFLNETYKELLKQLRLPERFARFIYNGTKYGYRTLGNAYRASVSDSEPAPSDPQEAAHTWRIVIRFAYPFQAVVLLFFAWIVSLSDRRIPTDSSDMDVPIPVGLIPVASLSVIPLVYCCVLTLAFIAGELITWKQLRENNFTKLGRLLSAARTTVVWPLKLLGNLLVAALGCIVAIGVLYLVLLAIIWLVAAMWAYMHK
jgi:hypothetical protein